MYKKQSFMLIAIVLTGLYLVGCGQRPSAPPIPSQNAQSTTTSEGTTKTQSNPSVVNVFVENSGSMYGYVKGVTEFEQAVYSYISDIKINSNVCESMNLFYINSKKIPQPDNIEDFIQKLEPDNFKLKGGNMQTTDLSNIIGDVIKDQQENEINLLVSDCVFSPGRNKNAHEYLVNQQIGIKRHLAEKLKENPDFAVIIYQLKSQFEGRYYNCFDEPVNIKAQRPFYIIIFGDRSRLKMLTTEVPIYRIQSSGIQNSYCVSNSTNQPEYGILVTPKIGSFKPAPNDPKHSILNAKIDKRNPISPFTLSVGVNYHDFLLDDDYICNEDNYTCNNKAYEIDIDKNKGSFSSYTHIVKLSLIGNIISRGRIDITLKKQSPTWAEDMTDEDGKDINAGDAINKTFGLKYMINGIFDAYSKDADYLTISINIK